MAELDEHFAALADPTRLAIVRLLGIEPLRPSEIASELGISRPLASRHLRVLRQAGIVADEVQRDDARQRYYRLQREPFDQVRDFLTEVEAYWTDQLHAFKRHVERKR